MDWKMFLGGVFMILVAVLLLVSSIWAYGKDGEEKSEYNKMKKTRDWFGVVTFTLGGLVVIFCSL